MKKLPKCQEIIIIQQEIYYHQKYKLFEIDLSGQTDMSIPEQINSVEKSEEDDDATMLFIAEK